MIALINDYNNEAIKFLVDLGLDVDDLHRKLEKRLVLDSKNTPPLSTSLLPMGVYAKKIIKESEKESDKLKESILDTTTYYAFPS